MALRQRAQHPSYSGISTTVTHPSSFDAGWSRVATPYDSPDAREIDMSAPSPFASYTDAAMCKGRKSDPESPHDSPSDSPTCSPSSSQQLFSSMPTMPAWVPRGRKSDPESPHDSPTPSLPKSGAPLSTAKTAALALATISLCGLVVLLTDWFMPSHPEPLPQTMIRGFQFGRRKEDHYVDMKICTTPDCHADCRVVNRDRRLHISGTAGFHKLSHEKHSGIICNKPYYVDIKVCSNPGEHVDEHPLHYSLHFDQHENKKKPSADKTCIRKYKGHPLHLNMTLPVNTTVHIAICPDGNSAPIEHEAHCIEESAKNQAWLNANVQALNRAEEIAEEDALDRSLAALDASTSHWHDLTGSTGNAGGDDSHLIQDDLHGDLHGDPFSDLPTDNPHSYDHTHSDGYGHSDGDDSDGEHHDEHEDDFEAEPGAYDPNDPENHDEHPYEGDTHDYEDYHSDDEDPYPDEEDSHDPSYYEDDSHDPHE